MFTLMIHAGHEGSNHFAEKNIQYRHLHIPHISRKKTFNCLNLVEISI